MKFRGLLCATACALKAAAALGAPLMTRHVPAAADLAHYAGAARADQVMHLAITLPLHHEAALDRFLADLSNPKSPRFRHFLQGSEFADRYGPTPAEYAALLDFVRRHGLALRQTAKNRYLVAVDAPVSAVEQAFHVRIGLYRHPDGSRLFYAPDREPTVDMAVPVLHVSGLDDFNLPVSHAVRGDARNAAIFPHGGTAPGGNYSGTDLRTAYYGTSKALTGVSQTVALVEFAGWNPADVTQYFTNLGQTSRVPVIGISVDGTSLSCTGTCDDFEQALDIEQVAAIAPGLKQISVYVGSTAVTILNSIAADDKARQISSSWAWAPEVATDTPVLKQFAAQGQSFFVATGDTGSQLATGGIWPADSRYTVAVGGTVLATNGAGGPWLAETAWVDSGGGVTPDGIALPSWQKPVVTKAMGASLKLRNVPDVAADANYDSYACYDGTCNGGNGGTSFAAPRWAAFLSLVNEQAAISKLPFVGFVGPDLYTIAQGTSYATALHDITQGANDKYAAGAGYDLVTGLGSPQPGLIPALLGN